MVKMRDLAKEIKSEYISIVLDGKNVTYKSGMTINSDVDVPKGKNYSYKPKGGQWKAGKA